MAASAKVVLGARVRAVRNSLTGGRLLRRVPFLGLGALFWAGLYYGTHGALVYVRGIELAGELLAGKFVSLVFVSLAGFLFLSNLITAVGTFYLSDDLRFLRTAPLETGMLLKAKAVETVAQSSWMVLSFVPPVLAAMGAVYGAPAGAHAALFGLFAVFVLVAAGAGIAAAHVLVRLFPARRVRDAFLLAGLGLFILAYVTFRSAVPVDPENPVELVDALLAVRLDAPYLPHVWMVRAARDLLGGRWPDPLDAALLLSNAAFLLLAAQVLGERLFVRNSEAFRGGSQTPRSRALPLPGPRLAVLWKDALVFVRDTGQWSQLAVILALAFIYVYNFRTLPLDAVAGVVPFLQQLVVLMNVLMAGLVLSAVAARFVFASVSMEGRAFWAVRAAPVSMRDFVTAKFFYGLVPVSVVTLGIVGASNLMVGAGGWTAWLSLFTVLLLAVSVTGLGTGLGALWPRFSHHNIAAVSMSPGGMVFMISAFSLVVLTVALEAWPCYLYLSTGRVPWAATIFCGGLLLALNFVALALPLRAGVRSLSALQ